MLSILRRQRHSASPGTIPPKSCMHLECLNNKDTLVYYRFETKFVV